MNAGPDYYSRRLQRIWKPGELVDCALCGRRYRSLAGHTLAAHGIRLREYAKCFPGETMHRDIRLVARDHLLDRGSKIGDHRVLYWTRDRIIARIRLVYKKKGRAPTSTEWGRRSRGRGNPRATTVYGIFGSWNAALDAAGVPRTVGLPTLRERKKCSRGHALTPENGRRVCKKCKNASGRARRSQRMAGPDGDRLRAAEREKAARYAARKSLAIHRRRGNRRVTTPNRGATCGGRGRGRPCLSVGSIASGSSWGSTRVRSLTTPNGSCERWTRST